MTESRGGHYNRAELAAALRAVGVERGDLVFSHVGLGLLGYPEEGRSLEVACRVVVDAFRDVIGAEGTWLVPTYTYSYTASEVYDPATTPSTVGPFTDYFRSLPEAVRSDDPIFSVAAIGPRAEELLGDLPRDCLGEDSVYDRLKRLGGKICNLGVGFRYATFIHHIEQMAGVPYRYRKPFRGLTMRDGRATTETWVYNVRPLFIESCDTVLARLEPHARERGIVRSAPVGRGDVICVSAQELWETALEKLREDPWFVAVGPPVDVVAAEETRVGAPRPTVAVPPKPTPDELAAVLSALRRDTVSDGYDVALEALAAVVPLKIREYRTGTVLGRWIVPEKWTCHEAWVETMTGERLRADVAPYSQPFEGIVPREALTSHTAPDTRSLWPDRTWGFAIADELADPQYRVCIRASFSVGTLKVAETAESREGAVLRVNLDGDLRDLPAALASDRPLLIAPSDYPSEEIV